VFLGVGVWMEQGGGLSSNDIGLSSSKNTGIGVGGYPAAKGSYVGCSVRVAPFRMLVERGGLFLSCVGGLSYRVAWL
jgi:hypothetical protein